MSYITYKPEIWVDIHGYEGSYQVSDHGRVRSLDREVKHPRWGTMKRKGKLLKPVYNSDGYAGVFLYSEGKSRRASVHRLVAEHFIDNPKHESEVNHINEDKRDNSVQNLEWVSHADNVRHGTGIARRAKAISQPVIATDANGTEYRYGSTAEAARTLGILKGEISRCCRGIYKQYKGMKWRYAEEV